MCTYERIGLGRLLPFPVTASWYIRPSHKLQAEGRKPKVQKDDIACHFRSPFCIWFPISLSSMKRYLNVHSKNFSSHLLLPPLDFFLQRKRKWREEPISEKSTNYWSTVSSFTMRAICCIIVTEPRKRDVRISWNGTKEEGDTCAVVKKRCGKEKDPKNCRKREIEEEKWEFREMRDVHVMVKSFPVECLSHQKDHNYKTWIRQRER